jgi:hypothetical protein
LKFEIFLDKDISLYLSNKDEEKFGLSGFSKDKINNKERFLFIKT